MKGITLRNQPKYNFFKNTKYAINGLKDLIKSESSFKIELLIVILLLPTIFFFPVSFETKLLMFITLMGMPLAEIINSAIERCVDLVTLHYHEMAKRAKDAGSAIVFMSIFIFIVTWISVIFSIL